MRCALTAENLVLTRQSRCFDADLGHDSGGSTRRPAAIAVGPVVLFVACLALLIAQRDLRAGGALDPSFGGTGTVTLAPQGAPPMGDTIGETYAVLQNDGKIVVGGSTRVVGLTQGDYALARFNPDGSLDLGFGGGMGVPGVTLTDFQANQNDTLWGLALQADGRIVAAGGASTNFMPEIGLTRHDVNGNLDPTFGTGGLVTTGVPGYFGASARAVAIQTDGRIVVAGTASTFLGVLEFAVVRYDASGNLDPSFGPGATGLVTIAVGVPSGAYFHAATSIAIQSDGRIVVAGFSDNGNNADFTLLRLDSTGALDPSFGGTGVVTTDFGGQDVLLGLALQADGKIVAVGRSDAGIALARYDSNGAPDPGFGAGGTLTLGAANTGTLFAAEGRSVAIQPDGKLLVAGYGFYPVPGAFGDGDFVLLRLHANGTVDPLFGGGAGYVNTDFGLAMPLSGGSTGDYPGSVLLQSDGKIVAAGNSAVGTGGQWVIARYLTDGPCPEDFTPTDEYDWQNWAGSPGTSGSADGAGTAAQFFDPAFIAFDGCGNAYVTDFDNHTVRRITRNGVVTTLAGSPGTSGSADGAGVAARFLQPQGIAVGPDGNIVVADTGNHLIRQITPAGVVTTLAGSAGVYGNTDGTGAASSFAFPTGVAFDSAGDLYVSNTDLHTVRRIAFGGVVTTVAGLPGTAGSTDGTGSGALFDQPAGLAVDRCGHVYVADFGNHSLRRIDVGGVVTTIAGTPGLAGSVDGAGPTALFDSPYGLAVDGDSVLYIGDSGNHVIRWFAPSGLSGTIGGVASLTGSTDGIGAVARFNRPIGVAIDTNGVLAVADQINHRITRGFPTSLAEPATEYEWSHFAGQSGVPGWMDGVGTGAQFFFPTGIASDGSGTVVLADFDNAAIRRVSPTALVMSVAGAGFPGSADGFAFSAQFNQPQGVAIDLQGNTYIGDTLNHTVRKISPIGFVTTIAGVAGVSGSADGPFGTATFFEPSGVAVDPTGNVYVADSKNHTIRRVTPAGVVSTIAGTPGVMGSADGVGTAASFNVPTGLVLDCGADLLYVSDFANHTIRAVTLSGVVTTVAGSAGVSGTADGLGSAARFDLPYHMAIDRDGHLYIGDFGSHRVRKMLTTGTVVTIGGTAGIIGDTDGVGAAALFNRPIGVAVRPDGTLVVVDQANHLLREGVPVAVPKESFRRGDVNCDGFVDIADAIALLSYLFASGAVPCCLDAADTSDSGVVDIGSAIYLLSFLFANGTAPPTPGPMACGPDSTADTLGCLAYPAC